MVEYWDITNLMTGYLTSVVKSITKALNITGDKPGIL
jgi:hypothetical protein